ncbi:hypothetical protein ACF08B_37835 [Streptomyces sp. NPDC015139]
MQAHRAGRTPSSRLMARGTVQQAGRVADGTTFTNARTFGAGWARPGAVG